VPLPAAGPPRTNKTFGMLLETIDINLEVILVRWIEVCLTIKEFTAELRQISPSIVTHCANLFMSRCFSILSSLKLTKAIDSYISKFK
jgi:hypothetical protein